MSAALLALNDTVATVLLIILPIVCAGLGLAGGYLICRNVVNNKIGNAREKAKAIIDEANETAKSKKKESIFEAREEIHRQRSEFDKEVKERRNELQRSEQRLTQKEEGIDKKEEALDKKLESLEQQKKNLQNREGELAQKEEEHKKFQEKMTRELERVSGMSREEAKRVLITQIEDEAKIDAAKLVRQIEADAVEDADKRARNIVASAIQRCASDHAAETTVSVVQIPNDELKGRIIGREGRNIRALESATGIDLIIDDTPEAVILSGFDPVRREVARLTLEKLINDGRIHPARIEEVVEKVKKELDHQIKEVGENSLFETKVFNVHPELVKLLGRLKYRTSYGQNVLKHSIEVSLLAGLMANELGADVNICKRAGLLHDIGKAVDHEVEGTHISIGVELARKYKEKEEIIHCIHAHHGDVDPKTLEAILVQTADAISASRPGARRESLDNYVKRLEKLEEIANSFAGVEKSFAIQAGREVRIIVKPEVVDDKASVFLSKDIAKKIESELDYPGQIKVNVIREIRAVEYAK
ncbi:MAG: ribonuclease Y [Firmicutes bacterium]|nr:ribonuclease Y [Bacillota bacterium]